MKTAVFLVNFGAPRTIDEAGLFLMRLSGREAPKEAVEAVRQRYMAIGGASPLISITQEQAALLSDATGLPVACAFRYTSPTLEEAVNECYKSGTDRIVFFVMSPYYTSKTVGAYVSAVERYVPLLPYRPETVFIHSWHEEPLFRQAWVKRIGDQGGPKDAFYLFSAHSLPVSCKDEPYAGQVEETASYVAGQLGLSAWALGWQSAPRSDEPWMGPSVEEVIDRVSREASAIVEIPIGFVSDHLETLYDIDIVHRAYAESKGLAFSRVPSLNSYPAFIAALKAILSDRLGTGR